MDFAATGLCDKLIFRLAFEAGWSRYRALHGGDEERAAPVYMAGPVAMCRLIHAHGGDTHDIPAAAALAGPALFCKAPASWMARSFGDFYREVNRLHVDDASELAVLFPQLSLHVRLFLQASAVMLLEHAQRAEASAERLKTYQEAVSLYAAVRGHADDFAMDSAFEARADMITAEAEGLPTLKGFLQRSSNRVNF